MGRGQLRQADCHNTEQEGSRQVPVSIRESFNKSARINFFLPASKKPKQLKYSEEASAPALEMPEFREKTPRDEINEPSQKEHASMCSISVLDRPAFGEKRPQDDKSGPALRGCASINSTQVSSNDDFFKPASKKQKRLLNAMPGEQLDSMRKEGKGDKIPALKFDLWTEAKMAAEENAQLCFGKRTHPFFVHHKSGQRPSDFTANDCTLPPVTALEEMELNPSPPCHVTQLPQEGVQDMNMETWTSLQLNYNLTAHQVKLDEGSFDQCKNQLVSLLRIPSKKKLFLETRGDSESEWLSHDDVLEPLLNFVKDYDDTGDDDENIFKETLNHEDMNLLKSNLDERLKLLLSHGARRLCEASSDMIYGSTEGDRPEKNLLWTDMYQPHSPKQVCGNRNSVVILTEWLENWQTRTSLMIGPTGGTIPKQTSGNEESNENLGCFEEESDDDGSSMQDSSVQNVLLLAGPVGCGKTATIYACARAHGCTVIEVNCSDNRNGLLIKQKFSESMESHSLGKWSADTTCPPGTVGANLTVTPPNVATHTFDASNQKQQNDEPKQKLINDSSTPSDTSKKKALKQTHPVPGLKADQKDGYKEIDKPLTVLLFEDVDMVFEDDRGFIAAVTQLAATAKRPIILTSNDDQLSLPERLGADLLEFKKPSTKELVVLTYMICIAEGVPCRPELLLQMVKICRHDLRFLLNYLQFWCQGRMKSGSPKLQSIECPVSLDKNLGEQSIAVCEDANPEAIRNLFELEAQHRLWPMYLSVGFPCLLTQSIACELNKKVTEVERECELQEEAKLQFIIMENLALAKKLKKKKIISYEDAEEDTCTALSESIGEESDNLETPVKNLKNAKALARSPILRDKLKTDLASVMIEEHPKESFETKPGTPNRLESKADDVTVAFTGALGLDSANGAFEIAILPECDAYELKDGKETMQCNTEIEAESPEIEAESPKCEVLRSPLNHNNYSSLDELGMKSMPTAIDALWFEFQHTQDTQILQFKTTCRESMHAAFLVSELSENLSICDVISRMVPTEDMDLEDSCSLWPCYESLGSRNLLLNCATFAHKSFLLCIERIWAQGIQAKACTTLSSENMMLAVNDPFALGKAVANGVMPDLKGFKLKDISCLSREQESKRCRRLSSLSCALYEELPSKAYFPFQRVSFFENISFLARIGLLEQKRLSSGGPRRRGHRFQNYFQTHPWNLSKESIHIIELFGKYGSSSLVDPPIY